MSPVDSAGLLWLDPVQLHVFSVFPEFQDKISTNITRRRYQDRTGIMQIQQFFKFLSLVF